MQTTQRILVLTAIAALVGAAAACSSGDASEKAAATEAPIAVCYMADDPLVLSGEVSASATCACNAVAADDSSDPVLAADPSNPGAPAPLNAVDGADTSASASSLLPLADVPTGANCGTGFCKMKWASKKLKELAACVGIAAACAGGTGDVSKAIVKITQAICCATDKKEQEAMVDELNAKVKTACAAPPDPPKPPTPAPVPPKKK